MNWKIGRKKGASISHQLTRQIEYSIFTGELKPGEPLPSVRELSKSLKIHPLTVVKVYALLEKKGWVVSHWGKGTFVKERNSSKDRKQTFSHLKDLVDRFIAEAMPLSENPDDLLALFKERLKENPS